MVNIIVMDNDENFISFLDPDLIDLTETFENGLRDISVTYNIKEILDAQTYFKVGNKIWVNGDDNITSCLYVINNKVKQSIYKDNNYSFTAEEVLVELNYAPYISQTDITSANGFTTSNNKVKINYNALSYWFGDYFNIGVVQDCISDYASYVSVTGTMSLMSLLRYIEEETGNVFVTRYEKDVNDNTIHRYLDFLNQTNSHTNWELHFEYDFLEQSTIQIFDAEDQLTTDTNDDVYGPDDVADFAANAPVVNINPENIIFRITDGRVTLNTDGEVYDETDPEQVPLEWNATDVGLTNVSDHVLVSLKYTTNKLGLKIHNQAFNVFTDETLCGINTRGYIPLNSIWNSQDYKNSVSFMNGSYFEFFDSHLERVVFQHRIDAVLSDAHDEILNFGRNVEHVQFEVDESDTFFAISPVLKLNQDSSASNGLSYSDMGKIIKAWENLSINQGDIVPMIVQKVGITGTDSNPCTQRTGHPSTGRSAEEILGTYNLSSNYYARPVKPNDQTDQTNKTYEYWVGTAYWPAPYSKYPGELYVSVDTATSLEYPDITGRPDSRDSRAVKRTPKIGPVETSDEDVYAIYNDVAMKIKDKKDPKFNITTDVTNLRGKTFNSYNIHDIVYIKLPTFNTLVTAKVTKTVKNLHKLAENKITLENYSVNTKNLTAGTYIEAKNVSFKYPSSKNLTVTLKDATDDNNKLKNKLITFVLYKVENGASTLTRKVYTKKTNANGQATVNLKYDPGQYEMQIMFGGDAEYSECTMTIDISVGGKKETSTSTTDSTKSKTVKYKTVTIYYDKFGRSPDKKTVIGVGLPSRKSELNKYGYKFFKTKFKNHCPVCGNDGTLYWGWNFGTYFRGKREGGSKEGHFFCEHCDADFSGINGENHNKTGKPRLTRISTPVASSKSEAQQLIKGKLVYGTEKVEVKEKTVTSNKNRTSPIGSVNSYVKQKALSIVGDSIGVAAAKKIAAWMGKNIKYSNYGNFKKSAKTVLQQKSGNCCDQTRCMLELMDAAGCANELKMQYIFVCCNSSNGVGHVFSKITTKSDSSWRYVDPVKANPWGNYAKGWGSPSNPRRIVNYPSKPF